MARPPIHPDEMLAEELAELGTSAAELGRQLHVPAKRVARIVSGKRAISADTALRLGHWFGTGPEFWIILQKAYEPRQAEAESGAEIRRTIVPRSA